MDAPAPALPLAPEHLAFAVEFIAACRRVEDDGALEDLLAALRRQLDAPTLRAFACGGDAACAPLRTALPETTPEGLRACQSDGGGGSACLLVDAGGRGDGARLLAHVGPHLLDAVARLAARPARALLPPLTARELEVLRWLGEGKSNWAIGQILGISERTVKHHLGNLFRKLGVTTRAQAAVLAITARR